jgi:hypothetical protein
MNVAYHGLAELRRSEHGPFLHDPQVRVGKLSGGVGDERD